MMLPLLLRAWYLRNPKVARGMAAGGRVAAWLALVGTVVGVGLTRSAHADVKATSLAFGREVGTLVDESGVEKDDIDLKLNGQLVHVHRTYEPKTVGEVVGEYEKFCRENPSSMGEMWGKGPTVVANGNQPVTLPSGMEAGILKEQGQREGMIICISKGAKSAPTIAEAVRRFDLTQDLGDFGRLRYMFVTANAKGTRSKILTVWTDDSFKVNELALEGDREAPGVDGQVPRPEGSRRVLDVEVVGMPYHVRVYEVKQDRDAVAAHYDAWAKKNGFRALATEANDSQRLRGYFRDGSQVMVNSFLNPDGKTYASVAEMLPRNGAEK